MTNENASTSRREISAEDLRKLRDYLISRVAAEADDHGVVDDNFRSMVMKKIQEAYIAAKIMLPREIGEKVIKSAYDEIVGYGPIQGLLEDDDVSEVMVNGPKLVFVEKKGKLTLTDVQFDNDDHVLRVIEKIISPLGRRIDPDSPTVDARLPDGSRVNAVIPPVAIDGPSITIRKFRKEKLKVEDLIRFGSISQNMADFLQACVVAKMNIVISGGTGSGKTTLLNVLSGFIPEDERIVSIEDAAEL